MNINVSPAPNFLLSYEKVLHVNIYLYIIQIYETAFFNIFLTRPFTTNALFECIRQLL